MITIDHIDAAVRYHFSQKANITGLWGIYIAATFTGAAFTINDTQLSNGSLFAVTIGFWAFALGHAGMLRLAIKNSVAIDDYIRKHDADVQTILPLASEITQNRHVYGWSFFFHAAIDFCVTALIWRHHLFS